MKLEVKNIRAGYGATPVLDGVEFVVPEGKIVTLLGANGSGKSTILKVIGRMLQPSCGDVVLDGVAVNRIGSAQLARQMAILPQLHQAPGDITVGELVRMGRFPHRQPFGASRGEDVAAVERAIRLTRLTQLRTRRMATLSGGERQRAWIAMTLAQESRILLLDEPTAHLDIRCQFEVIELVRELNRTLGLTVLMVLHDLNLAARCSDLLITVREGRIHRVGTPEQIMTPDVLREVFGIEAEIAEGRDGVRFCVPTGCVKLEC